MMHASPTHPRRRAAFSLLEMVLSLSVLAVAFTAVGSVFVLATKVMPAPDSAEAASVDQSRALTRMVEDLEQARYITGGSANSITFVVDDRTGDGLPDRLSYAWSGIAGDPLTLSVNGSDPVSIANDVRAFSIVCDTATHVDQVPDDSGFGPVEVLYGYTGEVWWEMRNLEETNRGIGQAVTLNLPADATHYRVTSVRFRAKSRGATNGETYVRLYNESGGLPTGSPLCEEILLESTLTTAFSWVEVPFDAPQTRLASENIVFAMEWKQNTFSATVQYELEASDGLLTQNGAGDPWLRTSGQGMMIEVLGTVLKPSPGVELSRTVMTHAEVTLKIGDATAQSASARLYCEPGVHTAVWDAGFGASPVGLDMDGNGPDWKAQSGGAAGSFSDGRWEVDGLLYTLPTHRFDEPTVVDLVMGASSANRGGAEFRINADQADGLAVPLTVRAGRDASGVYCVRVYDTERMDGPRLDATGLGTNPPEVRLLIVPADNAVGVIINGKPAGSFYYEPVAAGGLPGLARLTEGSDGFFDHVSIRVGASAVVTSPAGAESDSGSDEGGDGLVGGLLNGLLGR